MTSFKSVNILLLVFALGFSSSAFDLLNRKISGSETGQNQAFASSANKRTIDSNPKHKTIRTLPLIALEVSQPNVSKDASPERQKLKKLPGIFRGDWGETPIYRKNDRVNFERGAYLSLDDDNQNQPPTSSPGHWRLVLKFKAVNEENCFSPAAGLDMGECDFTESGSLKDKDLHGALLTKAQLNGELGSADLSGANLSGAAIIGSLVISPDTRLDHTNLSGLQSDGNNPLIAESANLANTNFTKANLYGAKLKNADLTGTKMSETILIGSQLISAHFDNADLKKADMAYTNLSASSLTNAVMTEVNLEQSDLSQADLSNTNLERANFAGSQLAGANFSGANVRGVNFSAAQGADTTIVNGQTDFAAAICPDGVTVDGTQVTTCFGHGF